MLGILAGGTVGGARGIPTDGIMGGARVILAFGIVGGWHPFIVGGQASARRVALPSTIADLRPYRSTSKTVAVCNWSHLE